MKKIILCNFGNKRMYKNVKLLFAKVIVVWENLCCDSSHDSIFSTREIQEEVLWTGGSPKSRHDWAYIRNTCCYSRILTFSPAGAMAITDSHFLFWSLLLNDIYCWQICLWKYYSLTTSSLDFSEMIFVIVNINKL